VRTDAEIKQTVIAILTSVRDGEIGSGAGLSTVQGPAEGKAPFDATPFAA